MAAYPTISDLESGLIKKLSDAAMATSDNSIGKIFETKPSTGTSSNPTTPIEWASDASSSFPSNRQIIGTYGTIKTFGATEWIAPPEIIPYPEIPSYTDIDVQLSPVVPSNELFCLRNQEGEVMVIIKLDGTIEFGNNYKPDEVAKQFWRNILATKSFFNLDKGEEKMVIPNPGKRRRKIVVRK